MAYQVNGVGGLGFSLNWQKVPGDKDVARRVIAALEDRRVLFGDRHIEDEYECVRSVVEIRRMLTTELMDTPTGPDLANSLRAMRAACRRFLDRAGHDGQLFSNHHQGGPDLFSQALGELRTNVGYLVAAAAWQFKIPVEEELHSILPVGPDDDDGQDLSWLPGFD